MLNGLAMSLPGNYRLQQRYKLETPIKVATRNSCRDIHLSNWDENIDKKSHTSCRDIALRSQRRRKT